jgi:hypothetical protein
VENLDGIPSARNINLKLLGMSLKESNPAADPITVPENPSNRLIDRYLTTIKEMLKSSLGNILGQMLLLDVPHVLNQTLSLSKGHERLDLD